MCVSFPCVYILLFFFKGEEFPKVGTGPVAPSRTRDPRCACTGPGKPLAWRCPGSAAQSALSTTTFARGRVRVSGGGERARPPGQRSPSRFQLVRSLRPFPRLSLSPLSFPPTPLCKRDYFRWNNMVSVCGFGGKKSTPRDIRKVECQECELLQG